MIRSIRVGVNQDALAAHSLDVAPLTNGNTRNNEPPEGAAIRTRRSATLIAVGGWHHADRTPAATDPQWHSPDRGTGT